MNPPPSEMHKARSLPFVAKVTLSADFAYVIVELRKDLSLGLLHRNTLFYPANAFTVSLLEATIAKMKQQQSGESLSKSKQ